MSTSVHVIPKKRKASNKVENYVILPVSRDQMRDMSEKETQKAFLLDNVWYPKSLLTYEDNMLAMPLWWVTTTRKNIAQIGGDVSNVQEPSYSYLVPGNYTIELTATDANGCSATKSYTVGSATPISASASATQSGPRRPAPAA